MVFFLSMKFFNMPEVCWTRKSLLTDEIAHAVAESQGSTVIDDIKAGKYFAWGVFPHAHLHKGRYHVVYVLCRLRGEFHVDF